MRIIVGILVNHRSGSANEVQDILSKYGCIIKTRLGLHEAGSDCSDEGLIILEMIEQKDQAAVEYFLDELGRLDDVKAKRMDF